MTPGLITGLEFSNRFRIRTACLTSLLSLNLLAACDKPQLSVDSSASSASTLVPRSVSALNEKGDLLLNFSINDVQVYQGLWIPGSGSPLQVEANLMQEDVNEIVIIFAYQADAESELIRLATATHLLPAAAAGSTISFPAIVYRYEDSDSDGLYNVHELAVGNSDVDADGESNVYDTDSDGDGIPDGRDPTAYGEWSFHNENNPMRQIDVQLSDGTSRVLSIDHIVGDPEEVSHLVDTLGLVSLQTPATWPTTVNDVVQLQSDNPPVNDSSEVAVSGGWTAFSLGGRDRTACPDWRLLLDASSINNNTTQPVLLYFRLADQQPRLVPLDATSIDNLDVYDHAPPIDGNGPLNNSLRLVLVPRSTLGWIELWSERSLSGLVCSINLSTD